MRETAGGARCDDDDGKTAARGGTRGRGEGVRVWPDVLATCVEVCFDIETLVLVAPLGL